MVKKDQGVVGRLTIPCRELNGKLYGAVPVSASIGGASLGDDLFAVVCGEEKWCSTRADCEEWLVRHGLTETEATLVVDVGKLLDEKKALQDKTDLAEQEERGLFDEEVGKIVDGVLEDLKQGVYSTRDELAWACHRAVEESSYARIACLARAAVARSHTVLLEAAKKVLDQRVQEHLTAKDEYQALP